METGRFLYGGALQVSYLINRLQREGISNTLVCPPGSAIADAITPPAITVEVALAGDLDIGFVGRLRRVIKTTKPDLVHLHSRRGADVLGGIAAALEGTPCVLSRRVDNPESRWVIPIKYRLYDHVITISEEIRRVLLDGGLSGKQITCVRSAIDSDAWNLAPERGWFLTEFNLPEDARVFAIAAQLIERKGHRHLLKALPSLLERWPELHILVLGQGPLYGELVEIATKKPFLGKVHVIGFRQDIKRILPNLFAVVHPADAEGLGVALLQASSAGLPIVATRAGGIPEVVVDGETGYLCPPGDTTAIADAMNSLLSNPDTARRMGEAGKRRMQDEFSVDVMARGNLAVYRQVLEAAGQG
ncbi:glycosyl transferase, group 1 family [Luminiphilus syltensis NOR5-1B]|uniref:Glycosyl transferase, group 1 family n=1 Tax=Luminiphilus syltensis NOR5-1B TaxID=565045 RepID=B8KRJ1_9GAMM|nr:glycosyl transferase, group 1 family [Luminiphilus syltensis NOR5-1B]